MLSSISQKPRKRQSILDHLNALVAPIAPKKADKAADQQSTAPSALKRSSVSNKRASIQEAEFEIDTLGAWRIPSVGDRVIVKAARDKSELNEFLVGSVKYVGKTVFSPGDWIGVALDGPWGKNSGSALGVQYFSCQPEHGIFVQPRSLVVQGQEAVEKFLLKYQNRRGVKARVDSIRAAPQVPGQDLPQWTKGPQVGMRVHVMIHDKRVLGDVRFVGETKFAKGIWVGVALEARLGKNNGTVDGVTYFEANPGRGIFVRPEAVRMKSKIQQQSGDSEDEFQSDEEVEVEMLTADELRLKVTELQEEVSHLHHHANELQHKNHELERRIMELEEEAYAQRFLGRPSTVLEQEEPQEEEEEEDVGNEKEAVVEEAAQQETAQDQETSGPLAPLVSSVAQDSNQGSRRTTLEEEEGKKTEQDLVELPVQDTSPQAADEDRRSRRDRIKDLFEVLDRRKQGRLTAPEMFRFVHANGFPGDFHSFFDEYTGLCQSRGQDAAMGLDMVFFASLVENSMDSYYCNDETLDMLLSKLTVESNDAATIEAPQVMQPSADLIKGVFKILDVGMRGQLRGPDMLRFAQQMGFPGSMTEFQEEYNAVCEAVGKDAQTGLDLASFSELITNAESDYNCDESMLSSVQVSLANTPVPRDLVSAALFEALDVNNQGRLRGPEMFRYAQLIGFPGKRDDFQAVYRDLCDTVGRDVHSGFDAALFALLIDEPEGDFYVDDATLKEVLAKFRAGTSSADFPAQPPPQTERTAALFGVLDANKQGKLKGPEMLRLAQFMGFPGSLEDFQEEYNESCQAVGREPQSGLDASSFARLVNNTDSTYYCDDAMLSEMLSKLSSTPMPAGVPPEPSSSSEDRTSDLFVALDVNKQGRLAAPEMFRFAQLMGFPGSLDEFQEEYEGVCQAVGQDAQSGLDAASFAKLVNDTQGDYYCDDEAIRDMMSKLVLSASDSADISAQPPPESDRSSALFEALDVNKQGRLQGPEVFCFAQLMGFPGSVDDFQEEYVGVCQAVGQEAETGLDALSFARLVDDTKGDYYCEDNTLTEMLSRLADTPVPADTSVSPALQEERTDKLFAFLDASKQGTLKGPEMLRFAQLMGFPGSLEDFQEKYKESCQAVGREAQSGLDASSFAKLVNDSQSNYYCDDTMLSEMLSKLSGAPMPADVSPGPSSSLEGRTSDLFVALDVNKQGRLTASEMFRFAQLIGFPGSLDDFQEEYEGVCQAVGQDAQSGLDAASFAKLVNDTQGDYYCDDEAIREMMSKLVLSASDSADISAQPPPEADRSSALFEALDVNKRGRLQGPEVFRFAQLMGFPGSIDDFQEEYTGLCQAVGAETQTGLDVSSFANLVNDTGSDYYCDDNTLSEIRSKAASTTVPADTAAPLSVQADRSNSQASRPGKQTIMMFEALDVNKQGRLLGPEVFRFAQLMGFPGSLDEFQEDYAGVCQSVGQEAETGLDAVSFANLVNNTESDYYCDDNALADMLSQLQ